MFHAAYKVGLAALLVGAFFFTGNAQAQDNQARPVQDEAGYYSEEAEQKANKVLQQIFAKHKKEFYIETVKKTDIEGADAQSKWAKDRMESLKVDGVYLGLSASPRFFRIQADSATMGRLFTQSNVNELRDIINKNLSPDERLAAVTTFVLDTMNANATKVAAQPKQQPKEVGNPVQQQAPVAPVHNPVRAQNVEDKGMPAWVGWVCLIVGVLLVIWVIFAIIRAMTGMMGGGYGHGGMGGGGMGGGGGFLTGMLGGMFGAMAGMWMYNNFFGGHANYSTGDWGGGNNQGGGWGDKQGDFGDKEGGEKGDNKGDTDNDAGGGGGSGGCGAGGDAAGGGGGDWGDAGGGDAGGGGGGDWGGGGGDAGGGGGGGCGGAGCGGGGGGGD